MDNFNAISKCYQLTSLCKLKIKPEVYPILIVNIEVMFLLDRMINGLKWPFTVVLEKQDSLSLRPQRLPF